MKEDFVYICAVMSALCFFCLYCFRTAEPGSDLYTLKIMLELVR